MIFNNVNNLQAVTDFEALYSQQLLSSYPELSQHTVKIYTDKEGDGFIRQNDVRNDSPYTSNHIVHEIMRSEEVYNKCNFTREEEFVILAHEIGHMIAGWKGEKCDNNLEEEKRADQMSASLGLGEEMKSAIEKMIALNIHPENNEEMRERKNSI